MNSPSRGQNFNGYKTQRIMKPYDRSYDNKTFIPSEFTQVNGYECVVASPASNSYFYRMDRRAGFRGADRNTYFGINPKDIIDEYKTHTRLFVVEPNSPIVLINMNLLKNVKKLMESASDDVKTSIRKAFPIDGNIVKRTSESSTEHHDRRVLEYICSLEDIDGYYVTVGPLHPEIGFCGKSLEKLTDVTMFFVRTEVQQRIRPENSTRKRGRWNNESSPSKNPRSLFGKLSFGNNNSPASPPSISRRGPLSFDNLEGGKRKHRKTTQKKRKTQRKK
jgi:hypothetical protein